MRRNSLTIAALFALLVPAVSMGQTTDAAPCRLEIDAPGEASWRGLYGRGYEASSPATSEPVAMTVRHSGEACRFFVTVSGVHGLAGGSASLSYDVLDAPSGRSVVSPDPLGGPGTRMSGSFGAGDDVRPSPLFVVIPPGQAVRGGSYGGQAMVSLYRDDSAPELIAQVPLAVAVRVAPVLSVSSSTFTAGRSASIDLGRLDEGASADVDFAVSANVPVAVRVESANSGRLVHQSGEGAIAYRTSIGGRRVDLSSAATERFDVSEGASTSLPLRIEVDPQPGALAGTYSDVMTITFTAD